MGLYPVFLNLKDQRVLVVGGGRVAARKVRSLLLTGAKIELVSKTLEPHLQELVQGSRISYIGSDFEASMLEGVCLVIAATDDQRLNEYISGLCKQRGIWVNVVDSPDLCSFQVPSVIRRGDLTIAISTGGKSPALARFLRELIEQAIPEGIEVLLEVLGMIRERVLALNLGSQKDREIFNSIVRSPLLSAIRDKNPQEVQRLLKKHLPEGMDLNSLYGEIQRVMERSKP